MVVISVYTYGVKIIKTFRWESGFLWGVPWNPPLCTNGSAGYLMQLSVKKKKKKKKTFLPITADFEIVAKFLEICDLFLFFLVFGFC